MRVLLEARFSNEKWAQMSRVKANPWTRASARGMRLRHKDVQHRLLHRNHHSGQDDYTLVAHDKEHNTLGVLHFSTYRNNSHVQMVDVPKEHRRKGIGSGLMRELHFRHKHELGLKGKIHYGYSTPEGAAMLSSPKVPFGKSKKLKESKAYKMIVHKPDNHGMDKNWTQHNYQFKRINNLRGSVMVNHDSSRGYSDVSWGVQRHANDSAHSTAPAEEGKPSHTDLSRILKSVKVALTHHIKKHNPKIIHYSSLRDAKDFAGPKKRGTPFQVKNRKLSIYDKMLHKELTKRGYSLRKPSENSRDWHKQ